MAIYIVKAMLQNVPSEQVYDEFDKLMAAEGGYTYMTGSDQKIYALPPDEYEFDVEETPEKLIKIVKLICAQMESKYKLAKTPIILVEPKVIKFAHLEEYIEDNED